MVAIGIMKRINENRKNGQKGSCSNSPPQFGQVQKQQVQPQPKQQQQQQQQQQAQQVICTKNSDGSVIIVKNGRTHGFSKKQIEFFQMVVELVKNS